MAAQEQIQEQIQAQEQSHSYSQVEQIRANLLSKMSSFGNNFQRILSRKPISYTKCTGTNPASCTQEDITKFVEAFHEIPMADLHQELPNPDSDELVDLGAYETFFLRFSPTKSVVGRIPRASSTSGSFGVAAVTPS